MSIEAMKLALDALHNIDQSNNDDAITALRQAIEQAQKQEPVGFMCQGCFYELDDVDEYCDREHVYFYTHSSPPQHQWVGLSDEERKNIMVECESTGDWAWELNAAKAIEAKLKEKNT